MIRTVVLHHQRPGHPDHYDWLIDQPEIESEHRLLTFRSQGRPDLIEGVFYANHAPDHRVKYLDFEGQLSDNRGRVDRVAQGDVLLIQRKERTIQLSIRWGQFMRKYDAVIAQQSTGLDEAVWRFESSPERS